MNADVLNDFERCLGWVLLHFLWQGAVVAALLVVALRMLRRAAPIRRYLAGCVALLLLGLAPAITAYFLASSEHHGVIPASEINATIVVSGAVTKWVTALKSNSSNFDFAQRLEEFLPWVVVGWVVGVAAFSCRLAAGWLLVNRLRRVAATALDAEWHGRLEKLKHRLGITRPVQLLQSALLEVPSVIGWLKPVILLPAGCVAGLSPAQLESILAHELAHIRRHDYLVNLLQSILETLLFYHPAVWWVSRKVREERENCCDDLAVEACGNRIEYVRALATLEEMRSPGRLALAANGSELLPRIRRLAGKTDGAVNRAAWPIAGIVVLVFLAVMFFGWHRHLKTDHSSAMSSTNAYGRQSGALETRVYHLPSGFLGPVGVAVDSPNGVRETRVFHVRPDFLRLADEGTSSTNLNPSVQTIIRKFFETAGIDWSTNNPANAGKQFIYKDRRGLLMVHSTPSDLNLIEQAISKLNTVLPEVNLKVVFVELGGTFDPLTGPDGVWKNKLHNVTTGGVLMGEPYSENVTTGILSESDLKLVVNKLERRNDVDELNAPGVTTESGRQAQIQAVDTPDIKTGVLHPAAASSVTGTNHDKAVQLPVGPVVDLVADVLKGNEDIRLNVIPSITELLEYDAASTDNHPPLPHFRIRKFATQRTIHDGETLVLVGPSKHSKKNLLIFVTATLINPDGTRYHP